MYTFLAKLNIHQCFTWNISKRQTIWQLRSFLAGILQNTENIYSNYSHDREVINMQRIAIIDIGSNSARLVISHIYKNGAYNMVYNQKEALRLSQKVDSNNMLTEAAFASTLETMKSFAYMCKIYKVDKTIAVATAAIRNAYNGVDLVSRVMEVTGIQLHIISGNTEAYISYLGVINTLDVKNGIIFDLGGGSTELILFQNRQIVESVSLPLGAVNTTGMFNTRNEMPPNVFSDVNFFVKSH